MKTSKEKKSRLHVLAVGLVALIIVVLGTGLYLNKHKKTDNSPTAQMQTLVAEVSKLMQLPTNEQPTVATVTNQAEVSKQAFFVNAHNGDKVLLYTKNKLAILYRPSDNKIINVGPINGTLSYSQFTVAISNSTSNSQYTSSVDSQLAASFPEAKIVEKTNTSHAFPNTIVIAINNTDLNLAAEVASAIGGQIGILPIGVASPNADILIIIGQNYAQ